MEKGLDAEFVYSIICQMTRNIRILEDQETLTDLSDNINKAWQDAGIVNMHCKATYNVTRAELERITSKKYATRVNKATYALERGHIAMIDDKERLDVAMVVACLLVYGTRIALELPENDGIDRTDLIELMMTLDNNIKYNAAHTIKLAKTRSTT